MVNVEIGSIYSRSTAELLCGQNQRNRLLHLLSKFADYYLALSKLPVNAIISQQSEFISSYTSTMPIKM